VATDEFAERQPSDLRRIAQAIEVLGGDVVRDDVLGSVALPSIRYAIENISGLSSWYTSSTPASGCE
jgi:hypothetical protein